MKRIFQNLISYLWIILVCISSLIVYVQSTRSTPLIDYSYQVDNAYRIFRGQLPYKDFFLVVSPGTYILMAVFMHFTGGYAHSMQVVHTLLVSAGTIAFTYWIIRFIIGNQFMAVLLCLPLLFSGPSIYPFPLYDTHAIFFILLSTLMLSLLLRKHIRSVFLYVVAGVLCTVPIFMKQNIGVVYTAGVFTFAVISLIHTAIKKRSIHMHMAFLFGVLLSVALTFFWLITSGVYEHAVFQLFTFPRFSKNPVDGLRIIVDQLDQYLHVAIIQMKYSIPFALLLLVLHRFRMFHMPRWVLSFGITLSGAVLFSLSIDTVGLTEIFILHWWGYVSLIFLLLTGIQILPSYRFSELFLFALMTLLLVVSYATFLSHGIVGSSNAVWPLVLIVLSVLLRIANRLIPSTVWQPLAIGFVLLLTIVLGYRVVIQKNMDYVSLDGNASRANISRIKGLSTPGVWVKQFESLIAFVETHIPDNETIAFLPGEDPFFVTTGRSNPLQFSLLHASVYTLQPHMIRSEILKKNIQWIIIKQTFQTKPQAWFSNIQEITSALSPYYRIEYTLDNYMLYKRIAL